MKAQSPDLRDLWEQYQPRSNKTTPRWVCTCCPDRRIFHSTDDLWEHAKKTHQNQFPPETNDEERRHFRLQYEADSAVRRMELKPTTEYDRTSNKDPIKKAEEDVDSHDDQPRKRLALGDGYSAKSPLPRRSKARPSSGSNISRNCAFDQRPQVLKKQLWTPDQDSSLTRASVDSFNSASVQIRRARNQALQSKPKKNFHTPSLTMSCQSYAPSPENTTPPEILTNKMPTQLQISQPPSREIPCDMIRQPETRPISQEQLVAEVKGIYAGLVMVEAKCIEVVNKQDTPAQADGPQPKLNNEQWQALITLHRTLLREHHDFFLASQHPSASPALRHLASKYAMPARMWRHGIHSFLELLRYRLPASLDHMLAFIYLAYSMMALLYEAVPEFEDTWIECLGDLGRYRMAIEDDDIRDREIWTSVVRRWYSKVLDKAPTTGSLYHHWAILARPNPFQQLFYDAKSLCVVVPFTSARESILPLFDPVLNTDNGHRQYRLPPFDTAFIKAHSLLFTKRDMERFEPAVQEFTKLLDNQIGRGTHKFMEQGYYIAVANYVAMLGFASKENPLMGAIPTTRYDSDTPMATFRNALDLSNASLEVVLERIGFLYRMSRHPEAMSLVPAELPWKSLATMLNTLLWSHKDFHHIELEAVPPENDDHRPFPEDYVLRGLLWSEGYFPGTWFTYEKIDEDEKHYELASMNGQKKESILWLAHRIDSAARSVGSSFLGLLQKKTIRSMILLSQIFKSFQVTAALPTPVITESQLKTGSGGFINYFAGQWHQLKDHLSGPVVENTGYACLLTGTYYGLTRCDEGLWKETNLLEIATTATSSYSYFLGNEEWLSDPQVAMVASLNIRLSVKVLQQKLSEFPKSWMPTVFFIESASFGSAGMLAKYMPAPGGRYQNPWVQAAMLLPLTNIFFTALWIIFIRNSGVAKRLEGEGLFTAIVEFFQRRLPAILAFALILVLLAKV